MDVRLKNDSELEIIDCMAYNGYGGVKVQQFTLRLGPEQGKKQEPTTNDVTLLGEVSTVSFDDVLSTFSSRSSRTFQIGGGTPWAIVGAYFFSLLVSGI